MRGHKHIVIEPHEALPHYQGAFFAGAIQPEKGKHMRTFAILALVWVVIGAASAEAQTQRTELCVPGIADIYRFTVPLFTQHEFRVYAERNNPGIFFLIFDPDNDVRGSAASNSRSLYWSAGLIRGRHEIAVACVRRARYHIVHVRGNEIRLAAPRHISFLTNADLGSKLGAELVTDVHIERQLLRYMGELIDGGESAAVSR